MIFDFSAKEVMRLRREHHMRRCIENLRKGQEFIKQRDAQKKSQYQRDYYLKNRDKILNRHKKYYAERKRKYD